MEMIGEAQFYERVSANHCIIMWHFHFQISSLSGLFNFRNYEGVTVPGEMKYFYRIFRDML